MAASSSEIEEFLGGPLVSWLKSCLPQPDRLSEYASLFDGEILYEVILQIDPEPSHHVLNLVGLEDQALLLGRIRNFDSVIKNVRALYEDELGQTLLVVPECICLGKAPESRDGLENMKLLILLLLGAAVQCPNKEIFITRIKELDVELQHSIVECIQQVTDMQTVVLTRDAVDLFQTPAMYHHIRRLAKERDHFHSNWANVVITEGICGEPETSKLNVGRSLSSSQNVSSVTQNNTESNHLAVELADWKARLRKQRQELEEKSEHLAECKEELEHTKMVLTKLRSESQEWFSEARKAGAYRDEVDALREKAERADKLETEIQKYRDRLADAEYFKTRVTELREDNKALMETRDALEEQLQRARKRADQCLALEANMIRLKREANDIALERDADQQKIQELIEENNHLQSVTKSMLSESNHSANDTDNEFEGATMESGENSLSEQLTSNAQARALKLELENKRLMATIDTMREQSLHDSTDKILDLEKEKKRLALKNEQLQENCGRLSHQNSELEEVFKNALEENRKLQDSVDSQKANVDRQSIERESERTKLQEFEKHLESITKDKQRIQMLCESIQRRAEDMEKSLDAKTKELTAIKPDADKATGLIIQTEELKTKICYMEKEGNSLQREVLKLKESLEEKDVSLDRCTTDIKMKERELERLTKDLDIATVQIVKLQDLEKKAQELQSQTQMDCETIQTLQNDLVKLKVTSDKVKNCLEKLGLNINDIVGTEFVIEDVLEKIITSTDNENLISDISSRMGKKPFCEFDHSVKEVSTIELPNPQVEQLSLELTTLQTSFHHLQAENAKLQVSVATLMSQNGSLTSQQMTLQLANSQLAAEKEEVTKQLDLLKYKQDELLRDQVALQTLHEQLNTEYEELLSEKEPFKAMVRDLKIENRELKEKMSSYTVKLANLEADRESLRVESRNLTNLRAEHSKLKDDFRNLFTASERLKTEYRNMQEEYRGVRSELSQLKLRNTEVSGEANTKSELITSLELEVNKVNQHCDMLVQMNKNLDADRRSLMEHVSQLLTQYHELLAHSLHDKQQYHQEEKMFADRVNALCRQKEKLEEKIMEHYKRLDNCTTKRRGFGASFVQRMKKASSELINRSKSSNRRSISMDDNGRLGRSQITLAGSESGESDPGNQDAEKSSKESEQLSLQSIVSVASAASVASANSSVDSPSPRHTELRENAFNRRLSASSTHSGGGGDDALIRASLRRRPQHKAPATHRNSFQGFDTSETSIVTAAVPQSPALGFGTAGSRRTVYLTDDIPTEPLSTPTSLTSSHQLSKSTHPLPSSTHQLSTSSNPLSTQSNPHSTQSNTSSTSIPAPPLANRAQSTPVKENPTYLFYNRISTVIGEGAATLNQDRDNTIPEQTSVEDDNGLESRNDVTRNSTRETNSNNGTQKAKECAIWYEYGCV